MPPKSEELIKAIMLIEELSRRVGLLEEDSKENRNDITDIREEMRIKLSELLLQLRDILAAEFEKRDKKKMDWRMILVTGTPPMILVFIDLFLKVGK